MNHYLIYDSKKLREVNDGNFSAQFVNIETINGSLENIKIERNLKLFVLGIFQLRNAKIKQSLIIERGNFELHNVEIDALVVQGQSIVVIFPDCKIRRLVEKSKTAHVVDLSKTLDTHNFE